MTQETTPRWEYYATELPRVRSELVDKLGQNGWELVGFDVHNQAWFKRLQQPESVDGK